MMASVTDFQPWTARSETFELRRARADLDWTRTEAVEFVIGGRDLRDWARDAEDRELGSQRAALGYLGLHPSGVDWHEHLLGRTREADDDLRLDGRTVLLRCNCGDIGCWPLYGRILLDDRSVYWHDFVNPHRAERGESPYADLGPFRFDRALYEEEIARFTATIGTP